MRKSIKILLVSILVFTSFIGIGNVGFPHFVQADNFNPDQQLPSDQIKTLQKGIMSWYKSKDYKHYPFEGEKVDSCNNTNYFNSLPASCICNYHHLEKPDEASLCWDWSCNSPGNCKAPDIIGKDKIKSYVSGLSTYKDFAREVTYMRYVEALASTPDFAGIIPASAGGIIDSIAAYLDNPTTPGQKDSLITAIDTNNAVAEMNTGTGSGVFATAIESLTNALIWSIQPSSYGGYTENNKGVVVIWRIMRDFVNIILVIAMIVMAIATILGIEKYSWKNVLWKIAVVALLVNFSLVIVGMIVDLFNYFTVYFLNSTKLLASNSTLGRLFPFQGPSFSFWNILRDFTAWLIKNVIILFAWLFTIIALLAAIIAMIIRAIVIMFLAAISPLAFSAWIFPDTEKWWKVWWDNFLKWASFGLIFAIALYAGVTILQYTSVNTSNLTLGQDIITTLMAALFLIVGLVFSMQAGTAASKFTLAQAGKASGAITKWTARKTNEGITRTTAYEKLGRKLTHVPLFSSVGRKMLKQHLRAQHIADIRKKEKELEKNYPLEIILDKARRPAPPITNTEDYIDWAASRNIAIRNGSYDEQQLANLNLSDPTLDIRALINSYPEFFQMGANGQIERIEPIPIRVAVHLHNLGREDIASNSHGERIFEHVMEYARTQARRQHQNPTQVAQAANNAFAELNQQLVIQLRPDKLAALYGSIDNKVWYRQDYRHRIITAIQGNQVARQAFIRKLQQNEALRRLFS